MERDVGEKRRGVKRVEKKVLGSVEGDVRFPDENRNDQRMTPSSLSCFRDDEMYLIIPGSLSRLSAVELHLVPKAGHRLPAMTIPREEKKKWC